MSNENIYAAVVREVRQRCGKRRTLKILDVGAGDGALIRKLQAIFPDAIFEACDYHLHYFRVEGVKIRQVDLNKETLPYGDGMFDVVVCSEVVEHVENYRCVLREIHRVLAPGGIAVLTTPNVLNLYSRMRYLLTGFANLFGPLPFGVENKHSTGGHIMPIPYFYLAHALFSAGFSEIQAATDKKQKTSFSLAFLLPFIFFYRPFFLRKEAKKYHTLTLENQPHVKAHYSASVLLGRTLVVSAAK